MAPILTVNNPNSACSGYHEHCDDCIKIQNMTLDEKMFFLRAQNPSLIELYKTEPQWRGAIDEIVQFQNYCDSANIADANNAEYQSWLYQRETDRIYYASQEYQDALAEIRQEAASVLKGQMEIYVCPNCGVHSHLFCQECDNPNGEMDEDDEDEE